MNVRLNTSLMRLVSALFLCTALVPATVLSFTPGGLSEKQEKALDQHFKTVLYKKKGPYSPNYCVCTNNEKRAVLGDDGSVANRCVHHASCAVLVVPTGTVRE